MTLKYHHTPIQEVHYPALISADVKLFVKREDLNNPEVSGNKWWKLKFNLAEARRQGHDTILTFGGAYSNHIAATAAAAAASGFKSIGMIRGEKAATLNPVLASAIKHGMLVQYISRTQYGNKTDDAFLAWLTETYGRFYLVPEGGSNSLGIAGMEDFGFHLPIGFDFICCPIGTGASLSGIVRSQHGKGNILGFAVMKGGESWITEIAKFDPGYDNWQVIHRYHFGGYAKSTNELDSFIADFKSSQGIPLEVVYSAKMMFGILDMASREYFPKGSTILAIHTGGLPK